MNTESTPKKNKLRFGKDGPMIDKSKLHPDTQAALDVERPVANFHEEVSEVRRGGRTTKPVPDNWLDEAAGSSHSCPNP